VLVVLTLFSVVQLAFGIIFTALPVNADAREEALRSERHS